jgi:diketogulonate reductase-like aldo/keto reductase
MEDDIMKTIKLNNQVEMPIVGLGTWKSEPEKAYQAVLTAIKAGYRHIDTAMIYGNEEAVGRAIKDSGVSREELFITTKLWNSDQGYESAKKAIQTSLDKLGLTYVDLYLIHWFKGYDLLFDTYKAMQEMVKDGLVKAIGVSNFNVHHLMALLDFAEVKPAVNQVETHIGLQNHFLQSFCEDNGIQLEAYAPLMSWKIKEMLDDETMKKIASKYQKTVPQVAIRWLTQRGVVAIPKSVTPSRIIENYQVFDFTLTDEEMNMIKSLNKGMKLFPEFDNVDF